MKTSLYKMISYCCLVTFIEELCCCSCHLHYICIYFYFYESSSLTSEQGRERIWLSLLAVWHFDKCRYKDILLLTFICCIFTTLILKRELLLGIFVGYMFFILACKHLFFPFQVFVVVSETFFWTIKHFRENSLILTFTVS